MICQALRSLKVGAPPLLSLLLAKLCPQQLPVVPLPAALECRDVVRLSSLCGDPPVHYTGHMQVVVQGSLLLCLKGLWQPAETAELGEVYVSHGHICHNWHCPLGETPQCWASGLAGFHRCIREYQRHTVAGPWCTIPACGIFEGPGSPG